MVSILSFCFVSFGLVYFCFYFSFLRFRFVSFPLVWSISVFVFLFLRFRFVSFRNRSFSFRFFASFSSRFVRFCFVSSHFRFVSFRFHFVFRFLFRQSRTYSAINAEEILQLERMEYETKGYGCFNRPLVPRWLAVILASEFI